MSAEEGSPPPSHRRSMVCTVVTVGTTVGTTVGCIVVTTVGTMVHIGGAQPIALATCKAHWSTMGPLPASAVSFRAAKEVAFMTSESPRDVSLIGK